MTIDFTCQKCEASFELDAEDLIDGTEKLVCPHCNAKAPINVLDDFVAALTEMRSQIAALAKKFSVTLSLETEDLEDLDAKKADEDEESDQDELDFEDDDVEEDDEEELEDEDER